MHVESNFGQHQATAFRYSLFDVMAEDDEPSDGSRVSFGSRQTPHARSRLSQSQSATRASPLVSFSRSLEDARKNADALVVSARNNEHVKKFKDNLDDFEHKLKLQAQEATAKLNSMKTSGKSQKGMMMQDWHFPLASRARKPPTMRKSYSATDFSKFSRLTDSKVGRCLLLPDNSYTMLSSVSILV